MNIDKDIIIVENILRKISELREEGKHLPKSQSIDNILAKEEKALKRVIKYCKKKDE